MENSKMKILAIDDNKDNLISLKAVIQDIFPEAEVLTAQSGFNGIEIAMSENPDLILLDILMPEMDGFEVCRILKKNEKTNVVPVVFLTALKETRDNRIQAIEVGAEGFLSKPIDETELTVQIRAMVKIKEANLQKRNEKEYLEKLVSERTRELENSRDATLSLLDKLRAEIKTRNLIEQEMSVMAKMLDIAPNAITIHDFDGNFLYTNSKNLELHGYTFDEFMHLNLHSIESHEDEKLINKRLEKIKKTGEAVFEVRHLKKDGKFIPLHVFVKIVDWRGKPAVISVASDLTDRIKAENKIRESEKKYRLIAENMGNVVTMLDMNLNYTYVSPNIFKSVGFTVDEYLKMEIRQTITPESVKIVERAFEEEMKMEMSGKADPERSRTLILEEYCKNGLTIWTENIISFIHDEAGKPVSILNVSKDITDRKNAEIEKEKLQAQLYQAQKMESIGRLAGGVAHDFNNMLSVIIGRAELAIMKLSPGMPIYSELNEIKSAAEKSAALTGQLLAFARKQVVTPKVMSLNDEVGKMYKMLKRLIGENIDLIWKKSDALWKIMIDPSQVDQILANLCVNAKDAIRENGKIIIETGNSVISESDTRKMTEIIPGEYVCLKIADNGSGMDEEVQKHLFEPFFTTKEIGKGTGLGLATVFGIVKQNQGHIFVESSVSKGTVFNVYFPRQIEKDIVGESENPQELFRNGNETILFVEDDLQILEMGETMLKNFGYKVISANSPQDAIKKAAEYSGMIHLLITDIIMPEINGRELADRISLSHPRIKCLFISGYTADIIANHGTVNEKVNFLQKPFSMSKLSQKIKEILGHDIK